MIVMRMMMMMMVFVDFMMMTEELMEKVDDCYYIFIRPLNTGVAPI